MGEEAESNIVKLSKTIEGATNSTAIICNNNSNNELHHDDHQRQNCLTEDTGRTSNRKVINISLKKKKSLDENQKQQHNSKTPEKGPHNKITSLNNNNNDHDIVIDNRKVVHFESVTPTIAEDTIKESISTNTTNGSSCKLRLVPLEKLLKDNCKRFPISPQKPLAVQRVSSNVELTSDSDDQPSTSKRQTQRDIKKTKQHSRNRAASTKQSFSASTSSIKRCVVRIKRVNLSLSNQKQRGSKEFARSQKTEKRKRLLIGSDNDTDSSIFEVSKRPKRRLPANKEKDKFEMAANDTDHEEDIGEEISDGNAESASHSSDSEVLPARKIRGGGLGVAGKRKSNKSSDGSDSDFEPGKALDEERKREKLASNFSSAVPKKRSRLRKPSDSGDDSTDMGNERANKSKDKKKKKKKDKGKQNGNNSDRSDDDDDDGDEKKSKRKHIRKIIKTRDLDVSTKTAAKVEDDRRKRIEERQRMYNQIYEQPDSVEVTELALDFDTETKEKLLEVDAGLLAKLKPHQVSGVKFMWDACFETISDAVEKPGSGCILAHCMGLGKTLQVVTLSHTLLANSRRTHVERILVISPLSTLNNWAREYKSWIAFARRRRDIEIYDMSKYRDKMTRIFKLNEWFQEGGVCILGYDMYRILANEKAKGMKKKQREILQQALVEPGPDLVICDEGHLLKNEKTSISQAVTKMRTLRRIVLTGTPLQNNLKEYYCMIQFIKPNLLGTYKEYMNRFVNPITNGQYTDSTERDIRLMRHRSHILHKMLEGCIQRRDYSVLAPYLPPKHEYVVYTTLSELQQQLYSYYMTTQREANIESQGMGGGTLGGGKGARLFQDFQDLRRIWTHPMSLRVNSDIVIRKKILANDSDSLEDFICDEDEEGEESAGSSSSEFSNASSRSFASGGGEGGERPGGSSDKRGNNKLRKTRNSRRDDEGNIDEISGDGGSGGGDGVDINDDPSEWWKRFVQEKELNNIHHSPKLIILMRLLQQCESIGDKLLVFSQSLQSLDVIEHFLSLINHRTKGYDIEGDVGELKGTWTPNIDYFRLDGSSTVENREIMCKKFNDTNNLRSRLFLISTRAGGLGINLVAANRVVIFDVSWNPSHDTQSIFRVYRFGQEKPCYIYRLIAMGTMEQKVYERQVMKQATAKRVIDEQQISRHYNSSDLLELYTYELKPSQEREIPNLPKDRLFAELLTEHEALLFKYHEHDSLLENEESENMNEEERKAAWSEYEAEKTRSVQTAQYMSYDRSGAFSNHVLGMGNGNGTGGPATSNKIFGFRTDVLLKLLNMKISKDQPELNSNQVIQLVPSYLERLYTEMNNGDPNMYKELLALHATLAHPSGMYMNPLLYANQNPGAAGYYQAPNAGIPAPIVNNGLPPFAPDGRVAPPAPSIGFDPSEVYEID